jgi:cellulose synthase/poly-beta-1,6-N-acetylglucosamine synthase-like glycosyltransferase
MLDHHMSIDQMTRSWAGHPLPFNGTCGIWRRSAIEAAGGWRGDTLAEDLDLSYRVWMLGRSGFFLSGVAVPGELPVSLEDWTNQQYRWATGFGQVARRILPLLASSRVPGFRRKLSAFSHLSPAIVGPVATLANLSLVALLILEPGWAVPLLATTASLFLLGLLVVIPGLAIGQRTVRGALPRRFMAGCLHVMSLQLMMGWVLAYRSVRKAFSGQHLEFVRTPKQGGIARREPDRVR